MVLRPAQIKGDTGHCTLISNWHDVSMPRTARDSVGNVCYHVLNGGNARNTVFHKDTDYGAFLKLLNQAHDSVSMRLLAFCLMPNHFHLVAWPRQDGDLSKWMQWLTTSHVRLNCRYYEQNAKGVKYLSPFLCLRRHAAQTGFLQSQ